MRAPEIRTKPAPDLEVPELFSRLRDLAYNLCWSWSSQAQLLFNRIDPARWRRYRNPIELLIDLEPAQWQALQRDDDFASCYHTVIAAFDRYMAPEEPPWLDRVHGDYAGGPFAYFSTEYGWHECLQIYSGGLGVLSGDLCKSASDLGIPFIGVGLMYRQGYFRQTIDDEGQQQHFYPDYDLHRLPVLPVVDGSGKELYVPLELAGRRIHLRVWKASVGRVPVLLLDSGLPINHPADRPITSILYVRGREMRLCQEIVLGMGGARVLRALGIAPGAWHMNEGHSALLFLERLRDLLEREALSFEEAVERVSANTLFTTHTPVPAGNEAFDVELIRKYFTDWSAKAGVELERLLALGRVGGSSDGSFNLTALAIRASARTNGVSQMHAKVASDMWRPLIESSGRPPIESVTNGVHLQSWIGPEIGELLQRYVGTNFDERLLDEGFAAAIEGIPDYELWTAHISQKRRLVELVRERALEQFARHSRSPDELRQVEQLLDPEALTIGFARRFATYKRADLMLRDIGRLKSILANPDRPVQLVVAGKAHPADRPGQDLIRQICQVALSPELLGRLTFVENYDIRIARGMVQGVDVWLNTPRRPQEASGTSGMKAAMNGVLNLSVLDGWWCEGYDPAHGWAIGEAAQDPNQENQDRVDGQSMYGLLEEQVAPSYYSRNEQGLPVEWLKRMKRAMALLSPRFSTLRMVREYTERYYLPAARGEFGRLPRVAE